ncbi:MAG: recombinase family protein [Phenylobacterium sp.]|nr:recombinase family protein [Phenylobacterium sp.]
MNKAYSYARFSTAKQADGDTLRRQFAAAFAFAEKHGLELDTRLVDRGVSSFRGKNRLKGALGSFLRMVEDGEISEGSYLLVDSMDRLSREDVVQAAHTLLGIALAGVRVVTLNNGFAFDRHAQLPDVVIAVAEITRSHAESAEKARKVAEAHGESKRRAREQGIVWTKAGPSWLKFDPVARRFDAIPERVDVLQRIFEMAASQGMGTTVIAQRLNREMVAPFKGGAKWHGTTVNKILRSRAVLGDYQPRFADGTRDGEPAVGYYGEPVVEPALFYRVQGLLDANRTRGKRPSGEELRNLFRGLCRCSECGGNMRLHRRSKDKVDLYECYGMGLGVCTNKVRTKAKRLEAFVLEHVPELPLSAKPEAAEARRKLDVAAAERDDLAGMVERLLDRMEDPSFASDPLLADRYRTRSAQLGAKQAEVRSLKDSLESVRTQPEPRERQAEIKALRAQLSGLAGQALYDVRSRLAMSIRSIVDRVTFFPTGVVTVETLGSAHLRLALGLNSAPSPSVMDTSLAMNAVFAEGRPVVAVVVG